MTTLEAIKLLTFNKATLSRVLSEIKLAHLGKRFVRRGAVRFVLVPGGGKSSRGSEWAFLEKHGYTSLIFVDIDHAKSPDIIVDLTYPWPFKGGVFDLVVSTWVLEHLRNPREFFREAFNVLRENGMLVCAIPFISRKHSSPSDWWRFSDTALAYLAREAGFSDVTIQDVGGTSCLACLSLLWPFLRLPLVGLFLLVLAWGTDALIRSVSKAMGRGGELLNSYPINYIVISNK